MANINDFKAVLAGGGARANQFQVTMPFPGYAAQGGETRVMSFLCRTTNLPGQTLGEVPVPFRGRTLYIAGDRTFETWTTTVMNDTDFLLRNAFERWMNGINALSDNSGLENPSDYQVDAFVDQLDRAGSVIKSYTFRGLFPTTIDNIELGYDTNDAVEEFAITYRYQFFESNTTT
ncbi:MAG: hypothetical protein CMD25_07930 [Flavobacteriales bacterium]|nr:hypothetical protein [Flavobacteriales bacterium]|tara:strand:- start:694 stop:1221 length:528 start_codon:yes stop_codon:yes gene_type:complete